MNCIQPKNKVITWEDNRKQTVWEGNCTALHRILKLVFALNHDLVHLSISVNTDLSHFIFSWDTECYRMDILQFIQPFLYLSIYVSKIFTIINITAVEISVNTFLSTWISIWQEKIREIEMVYQRVSTCESLVLSNSSQRKFCQSVFPTTVSVSTDFSILCQYQILLFCFFNLITS